MLNQQVEGMSEAQPGVALQLEHLNFCSTSFSVMFATEGLWEANLLSASKNVLVTLNMV